ncbi:predicted protein [Lichtheimia corymbifera JMRC:FSU:9682]|uniref:Uncharacterized protein n=2 Tax=Lichtheimia corymbifera JMRC:FSU:9682 TaxID=1263082 RepID=A0A068RXW6_9FUNG|nr:predicted protein [Lichtheimia corymbifera JMRC:FSU:9682]
MDTAYTIRRLARKIDRWINQFQNPGDILPLTMSHMGWALDPIAQMILPVIEKHYPYIISLEKDSDATTFPFSTILLILLLLYVRSKVPKEEREPVTEENQSPQEQQPDDTTTTTASKEQQQQQSIAQRPPQETNKRRKRKRNRRRKMAGDRVNQQEEYSSYQRASGDDDRYYKKKSSKYYNNGEKRKSSRRRYRESQDQDYPDSYNGSSSGRRSKTRDHHVDDTSNSIISTDGAGGGSSDATSSTKRSSRSGGKRTSDRHPIYEQSSEPLDDIKDHEPYRVDNLSSDRADDAEQEVDIPDQGFAPPPPRLKNNEKDTTLPEKFLSSPTMEQLGLDEQDARKFMQAFKAYNKLMAKEHMKQTTDDVEQQASFLPTMDEKHESQEDEPSKENEDPSTQQQQQPDDGSHKLIENNVKYDQKPAKPTLKDLVGKKVDKEGNVVDDEGKVLGKVSRDMSYLDGKTVNENGDIVDSSGNVYGKAEPVDPPPPTATAANDKKKSGSSLAVRNGDEDVIVNVDAHKGGISFSIHIPRAK